MMNGAYQGVFASLPGNLGARAQALVEKREAAGFNVHFIGTNGKAERYSFADGDKAERFELSLERAGLRIFSSAESAVAAEYIDKVGYDPFLDDATLSVDEVRDMLLDWDRENAS